MVHSDADYSSTGREKEEERDAASIVVHTPQTDLTVMDARENGCDEFLMSSPPAGRLICRALSSEG